MIKCDTSFISQTKPLLELSPKNALIFRGKLGHVGSVSLDIKNCEKVPIYYKVKSNANRFYSVRPNTGSIGPYGRVKVIIQLADDRLEKLDEIEANRHKFQILAALVLDASIEPETFWKGKKDGVDGVYAFKMKTEVHKICRPTSAETIGDPAENGTKPEMPVSDLTMNIVDFQSSAEVEKNVENVQPSAEVEKIVENVQPSTELEKNVDKATSRPFEMFSCENVQSSVEVKKTVDTVQPLVEVEKTFDNVRSSVEKTVDNVAPPDFHSSELNSCVMGCSRTRLVSSANHFFAQYCAEMVEMLLEKMSETDVFNLRKELNEVLTKYEAKTIDK